MIKSYFKTALRHLQRSKLYAAVNLTGLAIGLTSCILIGLYIWSELSFDRFHQKADRIARVTWQYNFDNATNETALTGTKVGPEFRRRFPEVEAYVRLLKYQRVIATPDKLFEEKNFLYADSAFFSVFSFPLLQGDPRTVLDAPDKLVLTQSAARKYFGSENPVGKTLKVGGTKVFLVSGVAADAPGNSQIRFDIVGSFSSLNASKTEKWSEANYLTYLLLAPGAAPEGLQAKIDRYMREMAKAEMNLSSHQYSAYRLEPLARVHLHSRLDGFEPNNSITYIYILAAVAFLILLVACVNYTNLSTAQSARRSAEVGMRKVMGARKEQVFRQFIAESFLLALVAAAIALAASLLLLPSFNSLAGKQLTATALFHPATLGLLLLLSLLIAFAAGAYPAFILSGARTIQVLKSGFNFTGSGGLRKSLIIVQFVISIFLVISTIVILQQLAYIRNKDLGYSKTQVLTLPVDRLVAEHYDDFKQAIARTPGVSAVGGAYEEPTHIGWSDGITAPGGKSISVNALPVDEDAVKTLDFRILAGSNYTAADLALLDTSNDGANLRYSFMLNEAAAKALGWTPQEAIGKTIAKGHEGQVKAVVKDFHFRSFHEAINPLVIFLDKRLVGTLLIKMDGSTIPATIARLEKLWKERAPHRPFEYGFLDESYDALYKTEQRTATVFTTFSVLAIALACLGLFALTAYTMVRRTKEIGIRKVLGATILDIVSLVSADFLKLVVIALLIAVPLALYASDRWLQSFAYRIPLQWWVFLLAGGLSLLIAFLTISLQTVKTSLANPVKNLRSE